MLTLSALAWGQWCRRWSAGAGCADCRGCSCTPKCFDLLKIWAKSQKNLAKKFDNFSII